MRKRAVEGYPGIIRNDKWFKVYLKEIPCSVYVGTYRSFEAALRAQRKAIEVRDRNLLDPFITPPRAMPMDKAFAAFDLVTIGIHRYLKG